MDYRLTFRAWQKWKNLICQISFSVFVFVNYWTLFFSLLKFAEITVIINFKRWLFWGNSKGIIHLFVVWIVIEGFILKMNKLWMFSNKIIRVNLKVLCEIFRRKTWGIDCRWIVKWYHHCLIKLLIEIILWTIEHQG